MYKFAVGDVLTGTQGNNILFLVLQARNFSYTCLILWSRFPELTSKALAYKMEFIEDYFVCINLL